MSKSQELYKTKSTIFNLTVTITLLFWSVSPVFAAPLLTRIQPLTNPLEDAANELLSIDRQLEQLLSDSANSRLGYIDLELWGIVAELGEINQIVVQAAYDLSRSGLNASEEDRVRIAIIQERIENIGHLAEQGAEIFSRDWMAQYLLEEINFYARDTSALINYLSWRFLYKVIPLRIVQVQGCDPRQFGCNAFIDRDSLMSVVDALNDAYAPAGLKFWLKSNERYQMSFFTSLGIPEGFKMSWTTAKNELDQVFKIKSATRGSSMYKKASSWVHHMSTLYSDPSELLVWMFDSDSLVGRQQGASMAKYPWSGRSIVVTAQNVFNPNRPASGQPALSRFHLVHEIGHFFGLTHPWVGATGIHPNPARCPTSNTLGCDSIKWTDYWDLYYCNGKWGIPHSFQSQQDAEDSTCKNPKKIEYHPCPCGNYDSNNNCTCPVSPNCRVNNRNGGTSDMECTIDYHTYQSGSSMLKGFSFDLGAADAFPNSFRYALNVMGYYSRFNAHLSMPGRFSKSQLALIRGNALYNIEMNNVYAPLTTPLLSERPALGENIDDYIWWSNGEFTFSREQRPITKRSYRPISGDFDGDGHDDVFWYQPGSGSDSLWYSEGDRTWSYHNSINVSNTYTPVAGDFDGNGTTDIIWYRPGSLSDPVWWFNKTRGSYSSDTFYINGTYIPVVGKFDNDSDDDIVWYDPYRGTANIWWSRGDGTFRTDDDVPVGMGYNPVAGDFDGNGRSDIFWHRRGTGTDQIWWQFADGYNFVSQSDVDVQSYGWFEPIVGDFNGDGCDDIIWDKNNSTSDLLWQGSYSGVFTKTDIAANDDFTPIVGKFDNDPRSDIFWYDAY